MTQGDHPKRIVFLAVEDEFAGAMQAPLYAAHPEWVVGSVISRHAIYRKNKLQAALFVWRKSGARFLAEMFRMKILRKLAAGARGPSPTALAVEHGVEVYRSGNINDRRSLSKLRAWKPDLVISTNFSHYIGRKAREVATHGTWNVHKSFLPHYRGMAPSFFALLEGAASAGATLHEVTKGFDVGAILAQVRVPVEDGDSVYDLNRRTAAAGGRMLAEYLDGLDPGRIRAEPQPPGEWPYHTYPTRDEVRRFIRKGHRF